jgi:carboxyl-terminal processing protease
VLFAAADYKIYKTAHLGRGQVGINVSKRLGYATVVSVIPGSPADKANLTDGDIIESIGPQHTFDLSLAMIQLLLDGQPGSQIALSVVRPSKRADPEKMTLIRAVPSVPPVTESFYENASILYLKPASLDHEHVQQIEQKLKGMSRLNTKKVLLDLRDVAAGDMPEAVRTANFFLKTGTIGALEGQKVAKQTFTAEASKAVAANAPLVVLVNRGTAGPAELVAAALLDNKRAEIVGEHTFGEGAQQKTFELPDGGALILSIAKYESPSGKKLQDEGVTPGILVASAQPDADTADDEAAPTGTAPQTKIATTPKPNVTVDDQLSKALDILKGKAA